MELEIRSATPRQINPENSPIGRLAPELIVLVFKHGHTGGHTSFSLLVSAVCRYWRYLALDTPSLWSPILFAEIGSLDSLNLARLYLERSKFYPVGLDVVSYADEFLNLVLENFVLPHLGHCRELSIQGHSEYLLPGILHLGSVATPMLERLELTTEEPAVNQATLQAWRSRPKRTLFDSPKLRNFIVHMVPFDWTEPTLLFRLENVTVFTLKWNPWEHHYGRATHNQVARVVGAMPKLRGLILHCDEFADELLRFPLLDILSPTLHYLELNDVPTAWNLECRAGSKRDFFALEALRLAYSTPQQPSDTHFFTLLSLMPHLQNLQMSGIDFLTDPSEPITPVLLPQLTRLTLTYCGHTTMQTFMDKMMTPGLIFGTFVVNRHLDHDSHLNHPGSIIPSFWLSCPRLEHIALGHGCTLTENKDLLTALRTLNHVKTLDLRGHPNWDDELLKGLATPPWLCPSLVTVSFSQMSGLTQEALEAFTMARLKGSEAGECAAIEEVRMRACSNLKSTEALEGIVDRVWHWI